jgi:phosphate starvation-inducible PhoH-like protein
MSPRERFDVGDAALAAQLFGQQNKHLKLIEKKLGIRLGSKGTVISLAGEQAQVQVGYRLLEELSALLREGMPLYPTDIDYAIRILSLESSTNLKDIFFDTVFVSARKKMIAPKSLAQKTYIDSIRNNHVVFGVGPAGTGKTYLAMAMGVAALMRKEVSRIMLVRPAVEAGENLNDAFVILDEAQNTTPEQMKMFLTRLGFGSRAVITGDVTQIDLPRETHSGLLHALEVLEGVPGIAFTHFTDVDVVRHPIVQAIVQAYQVADRRVLKSKRRLNG